jgi:hypothetical protein
MCKIGFPIFSSIKLSSTRQSSNFLQKLRFLLAENSEKHHM